MPQNARKPQKMKTPLQLSQMVQSDLSNRSDISSRIRASESTFQSSLSDSIALPPKRLIEILMRRNACLGQTSFTSSQFRRSGKIFAGADIKMSTLIIENAVCSSPEGMDLSCRLWRFEESRI